MKQIAASQEQYAAQRPEEEIQTDQEFAEHTSVYSCDSCGATMIADEHMMSTMCPFCGSPTLITGRMTREFKPDYIIPFKIDKKTAENNMYQWLKSRKMTPRGFKTKSRLTKMTPLYVPFWILDCAVNSDLYGVGKRHKNDGTEYHSIFATAKYYVKGVPFDASLKIANKLMEAIEPFDYNEMVKFDNKYLQGFYAQKFNLTPDKLTDRIILRMERYAKDTAIMSLHEYSSVEIGACGVKPYALEQSYSLYPVWFLNYKYNGGNYRIAINGQTGKVDGYLPVDKTKRITLLVLHRIVDVLCWILALGVFAGFLFGLYKLLRSLSGTSNGLMLLIIACIAVPLVGMSVFRNRITFDFGGKVETLSEIMTRPITKLLNSRRDSYEKLKEETNMLVGKRPPAYEYYDSKTKIEFDNAELFSNSEFIAK